jgi:hypothetical protein
LGKTQGKPGENVRKTEGKLVENPQKTWGKLRDKLEKRGCCPQVFPNLSPGENPSMCSVLANNQVTVVII